MISHYRKFILLLLVQFIFTAVFASAGPIPVKKSKTKPGKESKSVSINFKDVDIRVFIEFISGVTGRNFLIDRKVTGKVNIISPEKISVSEAYRVFQSVLDVNGFAAVKSGKIYKIIKINEAKNKNILTRVTDIKPADEDRLITQLVPLHYAEASEIKKVFSRLVSSRSSNIISYSPTNMLIITDLESNIQRLMKIVKKIDVNGVGQEVTIIPLEFAESKSFVSILKSVFDSSSSKRKRLSSGKSVKFVADERTNSIVLLASKGDTEKIISIVKMLDKDVPQSKAKIHVYYLENATAEDLAKVLQNLMGKKVQTTKGQKNVIQGEKVQITADKATNSLIITAEQNDYSVIESVIKKLDIPRTMVYIECLIMEVDVDKSFDLGTEWSVGKETSVGGSSAGVGSGFSGTGDSSAYSNTIGLSGVANSGVSTLPAGFALGIFAETLSIGDTTFPNLGAVIQAYKEDKSVHILSTPQILTTDNEEANILVGKKIPYLTKSSTGDANYNNYEYKDIGISLKITPQINDQRVRLKIAQETSRVFGDLSLSPTTLKRSLDTTVVVDNGNTIVLGGLIDESMSKSVFKVPCLGDIPLLKYLFSSLGKSDEKTNLYVFLTPKIIHDGNEAEAIYKKKYKELDSIRGGKVKLYNKKGEKSLTLPGGVKPDEEKSKPEVESISIKENKE